MNATDLARVTRLRLSRVGAITHDWLEEIGEPVAFHDRLVDPRPVRGLPVSLPFGGNLPVETEFWSRIAEKRLTSPLPADLAYRVRDVGMPLRAEGTLRAAAHKPRLETHLHPFGIVGVTTVDLTWSAPIPLDQAVAQANEVEETPATVGVGGRERGTTLREAAVDAASTVVTMLTGPGQGESWDPVSHRVATVISGVVGQPSNTMPVANSSLHLALHYLSAGDSVVADPSSAFVAQWDSASGYAWPANRLLYMLDGGTSLLYDEMATTTGAGQQPLMSRRHRRQLLLVAYITALTGLAQAAQTSKSPLFPLWRQNISNKRLSLLFGPSAAYRDWGLGPRALLLRIGATDYVSQADGKPLAPNANYKVAKYR